MQSKLYRVRSPLQILGSMWTFGPLDPSTSQARFTSGLIRSKSFGQFLKKSLKKIHFLIELDVAIWSRRLTIILILTPGLSQTKSFSSRLFKENNFWIKTFEITKLVMQFAALDFFQLIFFFNFFQYLFLNFCYLDVVRRLFARLRGKSFYILCQTISFHDY